MFVSNAGTLGIALGHIRDVWNFEEQLKQEVGAVECLTALLKGNTAVTSINLGRNGLSDQSGRAIAEGIQGSSTLQSIKCASQTQFPSVIASHR